MGLAAKPTLRTLCAGLKRSNKALNSLDTNFAKSKKFVKSLSSYFFAHNEKQCNHLLLACLSTTQANYDRASGVRTSRQKNDSIFSVVVCRCVAVLTMRFCAGANHRPRRSIPFRRCSLPARHRPKLTTTAQRAGEQADKKPADVFRRFVCRCVAVLSTLFRDEFARRACRVNTLCGLSRTPTR